MTTSLADTPAINKLVADARSLPDLISSLPPDVAQQLQAKPLLASKSPPAVLLATGVAYASTRYGLGWDDMTCNLVAGAVLLGVGYAMRWITKQPIAGIVSAPPAAQPS